MGYYQQIEVEREGRVGIIRLNRPEKLNAWTAEMLREMQSAIATFNEDAGVGAIVLTGNGRAFCAGADISGWAREIETGGRGARAAEAPAAPAAASWIEFCEGSKPLIAAVNGYAMGVGLTQILPMDIRIASDKAQFSLRFVKMGLMPELGSSALMPRIVGMGHALEMALTGRIYDAASAYRMGLVNQVAPHDELMATAVAWGSELAGNPGWAMREMKTLFHRSVVEPSMAAVMRAEGEAIAAARQTWEHKEAVTAFMEKREPRFFRD